MSKKAFNKIAAGLESAIAHVKGDGAGGRVTRFHKADVKRTRNLLGLSQEEFALGFQIPVGTLRHWEQGSRVPHGPARVLLHVIEQDPEHVIAAIWPQMKERAEERRQAELAALVAENADKYGKVTKEERAKLRKEWPLRPR